MFVLIDILPSEGAYLVPGYQTEVLRVIYLQLIAVHVLDDQHLGTLTGICPEWKTIEVAVIQQGVVLARFIIFTGLSRIILVVVLVFNVLVLFNFLISEVVICRFSCLFLF